MSIKALRPEFERMMINWAKWSLPGGGGPSSVNSIYLMAGESRSRFIARSVMPIMALEAERVDRVINALPTKLRISVSERWISSLSIEQQARRCRCCIQTYYNRVDRAHEEIGGKMHRAVYLPARDLRFGLQLVCGLSLNVAQT